MKKLYLLLLPLAFISCEKSTECCTIVDTKIDIQYRDKHGDNWLDQHGLNEENINIYFMKNGRKERVFRGNLDAPKMFFIFQDVSGDDVFRLFPSDYIENNRSRTLIEFSATNVDTVDCVFRTRNNSILSEEVWYNGERVWTADQNAPRYLEIVKDQL